MVIPQHLQLSSFPDTTLALQTGVAKADMATFNKMDAKSMRITHVA